MTLDLRKFKTTVIKVTSGQDLKEIYYLSHHNEIYSVIELSFEVGAI